MKKLFAMLFDRLLEEAKKPENQKKIKELIEEQAKKYSKK